MSKKLEEAIAAILGASQPQGCWASRLEGEAKQLVARLREEEQKGNKVSRAMMRKVLADVYDVKAAESSIRSHLIGECHCA